MVLLLLGYGCLSFAVCELSVLRFIASLICVSFSCMMCFSWIISTGILLARVRNEFYPTTHSFMEIAGEMMGPRSCFKYFTVVGIVAQWVLTAPYYLMAATNSLTVAFSSDWCFWEFVLILMAILIIPLQVGRYRSSQAENRGWVRGVRREERR